jgi:hypothetical protein
MCDLDRLDVANTPLSQFQNALTAKDEIWQVIVAVNSACERPLDSTRLRGSFEKWWPDFEARFTSIKFPEPTAPKPAGAKADATRLDKIEGALESIMSMLQRMRNERAVEPAKHTRSWFSSNPENSPRTEFLTLSGDKLIVDPETGKIRILRQDRPVKGSSEDEPEKS